MRTNLCRCLLALALLWTSASISSAGAQGWQPIANDLEMIRLDAEPSSLFSAEILLLRTELKHYVPRVITALEFGKKLATADEFAKKSQAVVTINANFFDESNKALGLVVTNGTVQQQPHQGGAALTGIFQLSQGDEPRINIVHRQDFNPKRVLEAFQAGPRLLDNGKALRVKDTNSSRRAGLCIDDKGRLILFATSGFFGATLQQMQQLLLRSPVNCSSSLNLDGGGSAQLYFAGSSVGSNKATSVILSPEINIQGIDSVPVVLALIPR
jgi:uncharacterized protein YigE (DUF2233 family)